MALSGFERVRIGIYNAIDDETIKPENIFDIGPDSKTFGSTVSASITNIAPTATPINGSDQIWKTPGKGTGNISVAFVANTMDKIVRAKILGMDTKDGYQTISSDTEAPYCVFELISHDAQNEKAKARIALLKGRFSLGNVDPKTNTNTTVYSQDNLTFTAVDRNDGKTYVEAIEDDDFDIDKYEMDVFGQKVTNPDGGATSSPKTLPSTDSNTPTNK